MSITQWHQKKYSVASEKGMTALPCQLLSGIRKRNDCSAMSIIQWHHKIFSGIRKRNDCSAMSIIQWHQKKE